MFYIAILAFQPNSADSIPGPSNLEISGTLPLVVRCKIPLTFLHAKEPSLYGAIPLRAHPGNARKIKVSLRPRSLALCGQIKPANVSTLKCE